MPRDYLHNHPEFADLIRIVAEEEGIDPALVEKDYWIMHCLYGLQRLGLKLELKGGTSLSKGYKIIDRFSEDIDIRIEPPGGQDVKTGRNHLKEAHIKSRKHFYDWLARTIKIDGIAKVERDTAFDNMTAPQGLGSKSCAIIPVTVSNGERNMGAYKTGSLPANMFRSGVAEHSSGHHHGRGKKLRHHRAGAGALRR